MPGVGRPFYMHTFHKKSEILQRWLDFTTNFRWFSRYNGFSQNPPKKLVPIFCVKTETQAKALQWEHNVFGVATSYFTFLGFNLWIVFTFSKTRFQITRLNGLSTIHLKRINHESYLAPFFSRFEPKWKSYWLQEIFNYWRIVHKTISNYCHHSMSR